MVLSDVFTYMEIHISAMGWQVFSSSCQLTMKFPVEQLRFFGHSFSVKLVICSHLAQLLDQETRICVTMTHLKNRL